MAKVRLVEWNDSFVVGIDVIDADHRKLSAYIVRMNAIAMRDGPPEDIVNILESFVALLTEHTAREEKILCEHLSSAEVDKHAKLHQKGAKIVSSLLDNLRKEPRQVELQKTIQYLKTWLKTHVFEEGLRIFRDFNAVKEQQQN